VETDKQWRIDTGQRLRRAVLQRQKWKAPDEHWDHDHCACCRAKFAELDGPDIQHEGYTTTDDYERGAGYDWVCDQCFADLKEDLKWRLAPSDPSCA
jgi:hypothetical protein